MASTLADNSSRTLPASGRKREQEIRLFASTRRYDCKRLQLPAHICRWACIVLGLFYTAIMAVSLPGSEPFYKVLAVIEMTLTLAITVIAIRWPRPSV